MRGCGRHFCAHCGEEMIHRDHQRQYEASSALGQIIHREGPAHFTYGDIDGYAAKWLRAGTLLKILEHKQPDQQLGKAQSKVLGDIDKIVRFALGKPECGVVLLDGSGVFIIRGELEPEGPQHKCDFATKQIVQTVDGSTVFEPNTRKELYDWLNGGADWTPRLSRARWWK